MLIEWCVCVCVCVCVRVLHEQVDMVRPHCCQTHHVRAHVLLGITVKWGLFQPQALSVGAMHCTVLKVPVSHQVFRWDGTALEVHQRLGVAYCCVMLGITVWETVCGWVVVLVGMAVKRGRQMQTAVVNAKQDIIVTVLQHLPRNM
jgi:hypothetical protein